MKQSQRKHTSERATPKQSSMEVVLEGDVHLKGTNVMLEKGDRVRVFYEAYEESTKDKLLNGDDLDEEDMMEVDEACRKAEGTDDGDLMNAARQKLKNRQRLHDQEANLMASYMEKE